MTRRRIVSVTALCLGGWVIAADADRTTQPLEHVADVRLPGPASRFDYQSIDTTTDRLYVSHMGAGAMLVVDLRSRTVVGTVGDLPRMTGVCAVPTLGKVYASVPGHHHVAVIDARTLRVVARVGRPGFPDGIAYAPSARKIYVSDESGGSEVVIDGIRDRVVRTIPLGGEAGNTIYDPGTGQILVAVQTRNEIVAIDPGTDRILARHVIPGSSRPHGMTIDPVNRLLFVASEESASLQTIDLETWTVLEHHRVGDDPDVLAFDPPSRRLYVASESGVVSVFMVQNRRLVPDGRVVFPHAHTVSVDPRTHLVYLALQDIEGRPVLRVMSPRQP